MLAEDLIWPKMQERSPCNQVGWEKNIFLINFTFSKIYNYTLSLDGPAPLGKSCERGKVPLPWGRGASSAVRSAGIERELQWLRVMVQQLDCSRQDRERESCTEGPDLLVFVVPSPRMCVCWWLHCGAGCLIQLTRQRETALASVLGYWH